jgi:formate-dependent phosphoribosylglycinamide formyltransferase (GAR transformylase)
MRARSWPADSRDPPARPDRLVRDAGRRPRRAGVRQRRRRAAQADTALRLFGKPAWKDIAASGVTLARADSIDAARARAREAAAAITIRWNPDR